MKKFLPVIAFLLFCLHSLSAQQTKNLDSIVIVVQKLPDDTAKFEPLYALGREYVITGQYEKALKLIGEMEALNTRISFVTVSSQKKVKQKLLSETARSQNLSGVIFHRQSNYSKALESYFKALKAREELNDRQGMAMACNNISGTYSVLSDNKNELKYMNLAINNFEAVNDKKGLAQAFFNQSLFYYRMGDLAKALEVNLKAQMLAEEVGDKITIAHCLLQTGLLYKELKEFDKSNEYYHQALALIKLTGDKAGRASAYFSMAHNYKWIKEYYKSLEYCRIGLQLFYELGDKKNIASVTSGIGDLFGEMARNKYGTGDTLGAMQMVDSAIVYYSLAKESFEVLGEKTTYTNTIINLGVMNIMKNNFKKAADYLNQGLALSYETGDMHDRIYCYMHLSELHAAKGEATDALKYHMLYSELRDSMLNETTSKRITELNTKYETEKKEQQIALLEKQQLISRMEINLQLEKIKRQDLTDKEKSQQLMLVSLDNEIKNLQVNHQGLEIENQKDESEKKKAEFALLQKDNEIKTANELRAKQVRNFSFAGIAALILFGGYTYYRFKERKQMSEKLTASLSELKEMQQQLIKSERLIEQESVRMRISRDLHDDIGSTLTSIRHHSEMAKRQNGGHFPVVNQILDKIGENAGDMINSMSDIIWAVSPQYDDLVKLSERMENFAAEILSPKEILYSFNADFASADLQLAMEKRKNIFLIYKEALNNSAKYSGCKNVMIRFKILGDLMVLQIKDDGSGFDEQTVRRGSGLNNMSNRIKDLNGKIKIITSPGKGTSIELEMPV